MLILTNDDGIDAAGMAALVEATRGMQRIIVAPMQQMSECSHCVTTRKAFRVEKREVKGERWHAVEGTPADCVRVALLKILPEMGARREEAWVLSGINAGGNLGADVYISGTVAAAREAAFLGGRGMALSQYRRAVPDEAIWTRAARWGRRVIEMLAGQSLRMGEFWNVNLPWAPPEGKEDADVVFCERSRRPLPVKYEEGEEGLQYVAGLYHTREYEKGSDIDVCFSGGIAVTRMEV
jgi:5'-nucleotidase